MIIMNMIMIMILCIHTIRIYMHAILSHNIYTQIQFTYLTCVYVCIEGETGVGGGIALSDMINGRKLTKEIRQLEKKRKYLQQLKKREQLRDEVAKLSSVTNSSHLETQPDRSITKGVASLPLYYIMPCCGTLHVTGMWGVITF